MNLIIDEGNSFTKLGIYEKDNLLYINSLKRESVLVELKKIFKNYKIKNSILSSVINTDIKIIEQIACENKVILNSKTSLPIQLEYKTKETLGMDRLACVVGANNLFPKEKVLVIDAGTCIKYDFIDQTKVYKGGSISPGINIRFKALNTFTEKLPLIETYHKIDFVIGDSTSNSLLSGVMNGILFEMIGFISYYQNLHGKLKVIGTGGDIIFFDKKLKTPIFANPNLVMWGLNVILNYNVEK